MTSYKMTRDGMVAFKTMTRDETNVAYLYAVAALDVHKVRDHDRKNVYMAIGAGDPEWRTALAAALDAPRSPSKVSVRW